MHARFKLVELAALLAITLGLAFGADNARGATIFSSFIQNSTGACQASLPVFDGQIRKRPLAITNEGTAPAFISCSLMGTDRSVNGVNSIQLFAENNSASPAVLNCTLVTGLSKVGTPRLFPKTITLPPKGQAGPDQFIWLPADNGGVPFSDATVNVTCQLPVGAGLSLINVVFQMDIGA